MDTTLARAWAAVARHPDLEAALTAIAGRPGARHGILGLRIDRLDVSRGRWETLAAAGAALAVRAAARPGEADRLRRDPYATRDPRALNAELADAVSSEARDSDCVAGRLETTAEEPILASVYVEPGAAAAVRSAAAEWWALLGVAVDNHRRLAELLALRETAEADRRALLQRSSRRDGRARIIGEQAGLKAVFERIDVAAPSDMSVLLLGATGSGKEVVARALHERSPRANAPFIRVNCGAIPPELIDSELFGHEKGSFTGAVASRRGWFERADGGTLLLDEVAELSAVAQVRLLRVLQEKRFTRVGGEREIAVDVRVVAATHRDLERRVNDELFREDLWYRLAVFPIRIPALAQRREDIAALARHFAERAAARLGLPPVAPDAGQIRTLERYAWPGNVRELISVIERAVVLGQGRTLDLEAALGVAVPATPAPEVPSSPIDEPPDRLDDVIAAHIRRMLARTGGRIAGPHGAARLLGLHPNTLRSRMARLGIATGEAELPSRHHEKS